MATGKLYDCDGRFLAKVDYRCFNESQNWWGELTLEEFKRIKDGDGYIIVMEDGRKGRCFLRKKVNRAVYGLSPLYCYTFKGNGELA
ncbi:MAG TPA: hypothetical protein G4O19_03575 [Dehalococcoidia bacterium]|nr:hypothetical protein [Dehalococcoidia bacterium]